MPLEEPDPATAGTAAQDLEGVPSRRQQVALLLGVAVSSMVVAVGVLVVVSGGGRSEPSDPPPTPAETPPRTASRPGTPVVSVGAAGSTGCPASWTVDSGGSPIIEFLLTRESAPAPPAPDGADIGAALQAERTTDSTATVDPGWTVRVAARNALGTGPASAPIPCD